MKPSLSLVIPAFNEAGRLPRTLARCGEALAALAQESEILVVDDGSTDATSDVAREADVPVPIRVLRQEVNHGKGAAVACGVAEARHSLIAFTDADCPYDLQALAPVLESLEQGGTDVAIGARDLPGSETSRGYGPLRYVSGKLFSFLTWAFIGLPFRDSQCGLKVFRSAVARELFAIRTIDRFGFDFEILAAAVVAGHRVERFPVQLTHDDDSRIDLVSDSLDMLRDLLRVRRNLRRGAYAPLSGSTEVLPCPLCGAGDFVPRASNHGFRMVECRGCALWYLNPMPTGETLAQLYGGGYFENSDSLDSGYANYEGMADDARETFRRRLDLLKPYAGSGRLLDVGAGFGYLADAARGEFSERWVVEMSSAAAAQVSSEHRVVVDSFESAELPVGHFDVVSMQDCLEHLPDLQGVLRKVRSLLRPGGVFFAVTPNVNSWLARLQRRNWVSLKFPEHVVLYSEATARKALEEAGFRVLLVQSAGQYARPGFLASRALSAFPRLGLRVSRILGGLGGDAVRLYVPSGSIAIIATPS